MPRDTKAIIDTKALLHNLGKVKEYVGDLKIVAMVKANAYGLGIENIVPSLNEKVYAYGVVTIDEAKRIRALTSKGECLLIQGIFSEDEITSLIDLNLQCVINNFEQIKWLTNNKLTKKIKVWVKVNTGMNRLGFFPEELNEVILLLQKCPWIENKIGIMTHLSCADEPENINNELQFQCFKNLKLPAGEYVYSMAHSAAIIKFPDTYKDMVRPGIMLYGISPFQEKTGKELGLKPVMSFLSSITVIHNCHKGSSVGYGATFIAERESKIGVVGVGYGDGYPRHITRGTEVFINSHRVPIVGRVSMDMLTVDLTDFPDIKAGDEVELWGENLPVEEIAQKSMTIGYELICKLTPRVKRITI